MTPQEKQEVGRVLLEMKRLFHPDLNLVPKAEWRTMLKVVMPELRRRFNSICAEPLDNATVADLILSEQTVADDDRFLESTNQLPEHRHQTNALADAV